MNANLIVESQCKRILEFEIPPEKTEEERQKVMAEIKKIAVVPGFRTGRAPATLIERRYLPHIKQEIVEKLLPGSLKDELEALNLNPVSQPELLASEFELGQAIQVKVAFEVAPEFELKDYKGLEVAFTPKAFEEKMVDEHLARLQKQHSTIEPVEGRPLQKGDFALVDQVITTPELEKPIVQEYTLVYLDENDKDYSFLTDLLTGLSINEEKEADVKFPGDFHQKKVAGQEGHIKVLVRAIKKQTLPVLDDEFAKMLGSAQTMDELRQDLRDKIGKAVEIANTRELSRRVIEKMVSAYDFETPPSMEDRVFTSRAADFIDDMKARGYPQEYLSKLDWKQIKQEQAAGNQQKVRELLILQKIASQEGIVASDELLENEINRLSAESNKPADEIRKELIRGEQDLDALKMQVLLQRVKEMVAAAATVVPEPPAAAE